MTNSKKLNNSSEIGIKHRYIDAEPFHNIVDELGDEFLNLSYITYGDERIAYESKVDVLDTVLAKLDEQPTADVQPVVHCKDCKYYANSEIGNYCFNDFWELASVAYPLENDFCSNGKKMDGGEHD